TDVTLPGAKDATHHGDVSFIDNAVDRATGTIAVHATIANKDFSLLPGQYVRARIHLGDQPDTLLVPQIAIGSSQLGKFVYV
ncbi:efflux transporter periplasmic adaptor subunit, partial [Acinetobacter baumannii]